MIIWFTGNSRAGKTTAAKKLIRQNKQRNWILLDGDEIRTALPGLGMGKEDRYNQNFRVAKLAKLFEGQGYAIAVAVICPYKKLRQEVKEECGCSFIYVSGGKKPTDEYPYEIPSDSDIIMKIQR